MKGIFTSITSVQNHPKRWLRHRARVPLCKLDLGNMKGGYVPATTSIVIAAAITKTMSLLQATLEFTAIRCKNIFLQYQFIYIAVVRQLILTENAYKKCLLVSVFMISSWMLKWLNTKFYVHEGSTKKIFFFRNNS